MANVLERALRVGEGRLLRRLKQAAEAVNHLEEDFKGLTDDELRNETTELRERYSNGESLDDLLPEAFAAVREAATRYPNVHISISPHNGPTSKADNLNWIYQRMLVHEEQHGVRFEMILTHDAEDLMDPDALRWINYYAQWNDMVQIPVLALPTPLRELAHGVYCDEFAEFQFKGDRR